MAKRNAPAAGSPSAEERAAYDEAVRRLVERLRLMHKANWSPTPAKRAAQVLAERLRGLAEELDSAGEVAEMIEDFHAREWRDEGGILHFKAAVGSMRQLAESAEGAAAELPNSRRRHALPFAAAVFVHLVNLHEGRLPTLTLEGRDVAELERIAGLAGMPRDRETLKDALSEAVKTFRTDPEPFPAYMRDFLVR